MKGQLDPWKVFAAIILVLIVFGVLVFALKKGTGTFNQNIQSATDSFKEATSYCKLQSVLGQGDIDGDKYANRCDICMGGNDANDIDNDGIADDCDVNKNAKPTGDGRGDAKEAMKNRIEELKKAGLSDKEASARALLLECKKDELEQVMADLGKDLCCTEKFWNPETKTCGIVQT